MAGVAGLAAWAMSEADLWKRLEGNLVRLENGSMQTNGVSRRIEILRECRLIVRELRSRGHVTPLFDQGPSRPAEHP